MDSISVRTSVTSGCAPDSEVRHSVQVPQPPRGHCSAAAKARAALDRPDPGGPVISQAWDMAWAWPATARCSTATERSWPIRSAHTPVVVAPSG